MDPHDYESCRLPITKAVAEHMLLWAHASTIASVECVTVSRLSVQGKLPFILQVRAKDAFKKGSLVLAPAHGMVLPKDSDTEIQLARSQGAVHEAMLPRVDMTVAAASGGRRQRA